MNKVVANADEAIRDVFEGATIMIGGFGLCGMPENLIRALARKGTRNLHTISNNVGIDGVGNGLLLAAGQIVHHIGTYVGENKLLEELVLTGKIKLELVPQGTFSERIRAGGAGIPAFYTPTGVGTMVAEGKETREFDGRPYLMERGLTADFAFVRAVGTVGTVVVCCAVVVLILPASPPSASASRPCRRRRAAPRPRRAATPRRRRPRSPAAALRSPRGATPSRGASR